MIDGHIVVIQWWFNGIRLYISTAINVYIYMYIQMEFITILMEYWWQWLKWSYCRTRSFDLALSHARSSEQLLWRRVWPPALNKLHENYQPKKETLFKLYSHDIPMKSPWSPYSNEIPDVWRIWSEICNGLDALLLQHDAVEPGQTHLAARFERVYPQFFLGNAARKRGNVWDSADQINNPQVACLVGNPKYPRSC